MKASFAPQWTKGMEWLVEMTTTYQDVEVAEVPRDNGLRQMTSLWKFTVEEISGVEHVIKMHRQDPEPFPGYLLLYFRPKPLTLSKVVVADKNGGRRTLHTAPADSFYNYSDISEEILDFPSFPRPLADDARDFFTSDGTKVHETVSLLGDRGLTLNWSVELALEIRNATQTWERGRPWWSSAERSSISMFLLTVGRQLEPWERSVWVYASGRLIRF